MVPGTDGVVGLPPLSVVPFNASSAQLTQSAPSRFWRLSSCPIVEPNTARQSAPMS